MAEPVPAADEGREIETAHVPLRRRQLLQELRRRLRLGKGAWPPATGSRSPQSLVRRPSGSSAVVGHHPPLASAEIISSSRSMTDSSWTGAKGRRGPRKLLSACFEGLRVCTIKSVVIVELLFSLEIFLLCICRFKGHHPLSYGSRSRPRHLL